MKNPKTKRSLSSFIQNNLFLVILILLLGLSLAVLMFLMSNKVLTANNFDETRSINYKITSTPLAAQNTIDISTGISPSISPVIIKGRIIRSVDSRGAFVLNNKCSIELKSAYEQSSNVVVEISVTNTGDKTVTFNPAVFKMDTKYGIVGPNKIKYFLVAAGKTSKVSLAYKKFRDYPYKIIYQSVTDGIIEMGNINK